MEDRPPVDDLFGDEDVSLDGVMERTALLHEDSLDQIYQVLGEKEALAIVVRQLTAKNVSLEVTCEHLRSDLETQTGAEQTLRQEYDKVVIERDALVEANAVLRKTLNEFREKQLDHGPLTGREQLSPRTMYVQSQAINSVEHLDWVISNNQATTDIPEGLLQSSTTSVAVPSGARNAGESDTFRTITAATEDQTMLDPEICRAVGTYSQVCSPDIREQSTGVSGGEIFSTPHLFSTEFTAPDSSEDLHTLNQAISCDMNFSCAPLFSNLDTYGTHHHYDDYVAMQKLPNMETIDGQRLVCGSGPGSAAQGSISFLSDDFLETCAVAGNDYGMQGTEAVAAPDEPGTGEIRSRTASPTVSTGTPSSAATIITRKQGLTTGSTMNFVSPSSMSSSHSPSPLIRHVAPGSRPEQAQYDTLATQKISTALSEVEQRTQPSGPRLSPARRHSGDREARVGSPSQHKSARSDAHAAHDQMIIETDDQLKKVIAASYQNFGLSVQLSFRYGPGPFSATTIQLKTNWKRRAILDETTCEKLQKLADELMGFLPMPGDARSSAKEINLVRRLCSAAVVEQGHRTMKDIAFALHRNSELSKDESRLAELDFYSTLIVMQVHNEIEVNTQRRSKSFS